MKSTNKEVEKFVKEQLATNERWAIRALLRIYEYQTPEEQETQETTEENNVGFNGYDANLLSSIAKQYLQYRYLSHKQIDLIKQRIPKYWRQIIDIAGGHEKFLPFMNKSNNLL